MVDTSEPRTSKRIRRPTWKDREGAPDEDDDLPEGPGTLVPPATNPDSDNRPASPDNTSTEARTVTKICTSPNRFALVREYQQRPSAIPDSLVSWQSLITDKSPIFPSPRKPRELSDIIYPYQSISAFLFNFTWRRMHGTQSAANRTMMLNTLRDPRFNADDLDGVNFQKIEEQLRDDVQSPWGGNGWRRTTIIIDVPIGSKPTAASRRAEANTRARARRNDEVDPDADPYPRHKFSIPDIRTRSLVHTMVETVQEDLLSKELHWHGYEETWQPPYPGCPPERVWGELYTSNAFLDAERDLINSQHDTSHPCVVVAYMIWSDSTHLAQFGQAKAWPIYAYIGNQSKYTRCKPVTRSARVIGYIPPVCHDLSLLPMLN
jgi:hypothetical protein